MVQRLKWGTDTYREDDGFIGLLFFLRKEKGPKTTLKPSWLKSCFVHWRFQIEIWTPRLAMLTSLFVVFLSSVIHQWRYRPSLGPGLIFSFVIFFTQTVGLLGRVISPSQDLYLNTRQHKHRINTYTNIHAHNPNVRAREDISCLGQRVHCDRWSS
jgi:hypothetical protein